jgi:hypothetical protein
MSQDGPEVQTIGAGNSVPALDLVLTADYTANNGPTYDELRQQYKAHRDTGDGVTYRFRALDVQLTGPVEIKPGMVVHTVMAEPAEAVDLPDLPAHYADAVRASPHIRRYRLISFRELMLLPEPSDASICKKLGLWHGDRPMGIVGYNGTGKSWIMAWLALQFATGRPLFGNPEWQIERRYRVLHLDYEMNPSIWQERYRELCQTMNVDALLDVENQIAYGSQPDFYLNDPNAERIFATEAKGFDIVMVDAFRPSIPGEDENDSRIRRFVDSCTRISAQTGQLFIFLLHTGHAGKNQVAEPRGTTAVKDALGACFAVYGEIMAPKQVVNTKMSPRARGIVEPFYIKQERVGDPENGPMRLEYMTKEQGDEKQSEIDRPAWLKVQKKILNAVRVAPSITRNKLREAVGGNRTAFDKVLNWLVYNDFLDNQGTDTRHKYELSKLAKEWLDKGIRSALPDAPPDSRPALSSTEV